MSSSVALGSFLKLEDVREVAHRQKSIKLGAAALRQIAAGRSTILQILRSEKPVYGINTGFGELADQKISEDNLRQLQRNLILSHAAGVGELLSEEESRAILFLRANELSRGYSGVRPQLVLTLLQMIQRGVHPAIPSRGSVGASGDLAPLAHMALVLLGGGQAYFSPNPGVQKRKKDPLPGLEALRRARIPPIQLEAKEGISLINGTQGMQAVGGLALLESERLSETADVCGAMSLEALKGSPEPFDPRIHRLKPHPGQKKTAQKLLQLLKESEIRLSHLHHDPRVQDPYSLRCMPQVHGAVKDALVHALRTLETEINSITDNPLILVAQGNLLSGGNFHGQALAFALDFTAIALTALGLISERRIAQMIRRDGKILPSFLTKNPGLESGWMMAQVTAAALASENKVLAHPASVDTIPTSGGQEDHVNMGMTAALKLKQICKNTSAILAIELLTSAHAVEFHLPLRPGKGVEQARRQIRELVPRLERDHSLSQAIETIQNEIRKGTFTTPPEN